MGHKIRVWIECDLKWKLTFDLILCERRVWEAGVGGGNGGRIGDRKT